MCNTAFSVLGVMALILAGAAVVIYVWKFFNKLSTWRHVTDCKIGWDSALYSNLESRIKELEK